MLFNSFRFTLLFLPLTAGIYALLGARATHRVRQTWILICSVFFYAVGQTSNLPLLLASIVFNWAVARAMMSRPEAKARRILLGCGIGVDIGALFLFKYFNFLLHSLAFLFPAGHLLPDWNIPLGLSFFTLTQVMYLVDTYHGLNGPNSLFDHATVVTFFPYLTSGPLVRLRAVAPQLRGASRQDGYPDVVCRGLYLFSLGIAKKVILADSFTAVADAGFNCIRDFSLFEAWAFTVAFLFQLYFDFSGYSDMAVGAAWMMGIDIPQNFNGPLRATSVTEFWQRWHISLSTFITNYLYTPILRSMRRATLSASVVATILAMALAGLWHGPAWTYVLYGFSHGVALATNQVWRRSKLNMPDWAGWLVTQMFAAASLVFFRAADTQSAMRMLSRLVPHANALDTSALKAVPVSASVIGVPVIAALIAAYAPQSSTKLASAFRPTVSTAVKTAALLLASMMFMNSAPAKQFVYFGF
jgi:D-alanyl-lipoteichoic acid acyltransferase DltB (MBOAT superfamily)